MGCWRCCQAKKDKKPFVLIVSLSNDRNANGLSLVPSATERSVAFFYCLCSGRDIAPTYECCNPRRPREDTTRRKRQIHSPLNEHPHHTIKPQSEQRLTMRKITFDTFWVAESSPLPAPTSYCALRRFDDNYMNYNKFQVGFS